MSVPPRVLCQTGCGDYGDPDLDFMCVDCHGDQVEINKQRALLEYIKTQKSKANTSTKTNAKRFFFWSQSKDSNNIVHGDDEVKTEPPTRNAPPSIDHKKALEEFLAQPRQRDHGVILRECLFLEREQQIRESSRTQLHKFMVACDVDDPVDPHEWTRYQYGAPRNVPLQDVDGSLESKAQMKLYCNWRRRTVNRRIATRRQLLELQQGSEKRLKVEKSKRNFSIVGALKGGMNSARVLSVTEPLVLSPATRGATTTDLISPEAAAIQNT